jgi:nuclear GTP-binding protein
MPPTKPPCLPLHPCSTHTCPHSQRRAYKISSWSDHEDFLAQLARGTGKLLRGGDPDLNTAARIVLYDWQRGKIPFYSLPPGYSDEPPAAAEGASGADVSAASQQLKQQQQEQLEAEQELANAAAGQQQQQGMFAEAVSAEDAVGEACAVPENAAAAAEALRTAAAMALRRQRRAVIPIREGFYTPADEAGVSNDGGSSSDGDSGSGSDDGGSSDNEDGSGSDNSGGGSESNGDSDHDSGDDDEPAAAGNTDANKGRSNGRVQAPTGAAAGPATVPDSGDESDGYGTAGLSWEAVLAAVQVCVCVRARAHVRVHDAVVRLQGAPAAFLPPGVMCCYV